MARKNISVGSYTRTTKTGKVVRVRAYQQTRNFGDMLDEIIGVPETRESSAPPLRYKRASFAGPTSVPSSDRMLKAQKRTVAALAGKSRPADAPKKSSRKSAPKSASKAPQKKAAEARRADVDAASQTLDAVLGRGSSKRSGRGPVDASFFDTSPAAKPRSIPETDAEWQRRSEAHGTEISRRAAASEVDTSATLQAIVEANPELRLEGFEFRLKTAESMNPKIHRKALDKGISPEEIEIGDALRYTLVSDNPKAAIKAFEDALRDLEGRGHEVLQIANSWSDGNAYQGINVDVKSPEGLTWELQFHTSESFDLKMANHADYEVMRAIEASPASRYEAWLRMVTSWQSVEKPAGWENFGEVVNYPKPDKPTS